jgi:hypothetical protein
MVMAGSFQDKFRRGSSPLQDDALRARLQKAILDDDPAAFRATLQADPNLVGQRRLYGVLVMTPEGMRPVMVDETGQRIGGPDYVIAPGTPIELLNVQYGESEMTVIAPDGGVWRAPYKPAEPFSCPRNLNESAPPDGS